MQQVHTTSKTLGKIRGVVVMALVLGVLGVRGAPVRAEGPSCALPEHTRVDSGVEPDVVPAMNRNCGGDRTQPRKSTKGRPVPARFFGMSDESRERFRQTNKNLICAVTGGPCKIISRPAATTHGELGIKASEFGIVAQYLVDTLNEFKVPQKEQKELMAIIATLRPDIVEGE